MNDIYKLNGLFCKETGALNLLLIYYNLESEADNKEQYQKENT